MDERRTVLVTGGAGYIGAHACKALAAAGFIPVTFDNFLTGWQDAVKWGPLIQGDLMDRGAVAAAFAHFNPVAVMHFAALSLVGESMRQPTRYWRVNLDGALNLVEAAQAAGCRNIVFSSTCATYGDQDGVLLDEATPQRPINAYGASKQAIETLLRDVGAAHDMRSMIFRYFNVAGADPSAEIGEQHRPETHLIPLILDAARGRREGLAVFGDDYATRDGTCIRDYVHVADLVDAHVLGLKTLLGGGPSAVYCLGSGQGFSVREVISAAESVTGLPVPIRIEGRRAGDAASLVCGSERAKTVLGWRPRRSDLPSMIGDAWRWAQGPGFEK
jgi:UDP-glucose 4-epimerase